MKLYQLSRKCNVRVLDEDVRVPPGAPAISKGDIVFFDHIDGMYSFCKKGDQIVHLPAWTEVERV